MYFNPRSPCGERLRLRLQCRQWKDISIHAPRVGSDCIANVPADRKRYFNPRSPCGERLRTHNGKALMQVFQSTLPVWGATRLAFFEGPMDIISIHAPRVGSDSAAADVLI